MLQIITKLLVLLLLCMQPTFASIEEMSEAELSNAIINPSPNESLESRDKPGVENGEEHLEDQHKEHIEIEKTKGDFHNTAKIKVIDKKLGKMDIIAVNIKRPVLYNDDVIIRVLACWMESEKKLLPESKAMVEFYTISPIKNLEKQFGSWIFSGNPALAAYNNENYEFILDSCVDK